MVSAAGISRSRTEISPASPDNWLAYEGKSLQSGLANWSPVMTGVDRAGLLASESAYEN